MGLSIALRLLERRGFQVELACNGKEAVDKFSRQRFDAVLMDVQMPVMDGFEATAAIRKIEQPSGSRVPIVAVTAYAMRGDRERCLAAGMDEYLSKPVQSSELFAILDEALCRA